MEIPAGLTESAFSQLLGCRLQRLETGEADVYQDERLVAKAQGTFAVL